MVLIQYEEDQKGPSYSFRLMITEKNEAEYLLRENQRLLHAIVHSHPSYLPDGSSSLTYERILESGATIASFFPDSQCSGHEEEEAHAAWMVHFMASGSYAAQKLSSQTPPARVWTISLILGMLVPTANLDVISRFDMIVGKSEIRDIDLTSLEPVDLNPRAMYLEVEIPIVRQLTAEPGVFLSGDPLVVLPKRNKKKRAFCMIQSCPPVLKDPEVNQQMFDESLVFLPVK